MGEHETVNEREHEMSLKRIGLRLALVFALVFPLFAYMWDFGFNTASAADVMDFSLQKRSGEVAKAFGTEMAPSEDEAGSSAWLDGLNFGTAGGLLGYTKDLSEDDEGVYGWLMSQMTTGSATYSYEQLGNIDDNLLGYAQYGATLELLGLSESREEGGTGSIGRFFLGWTMTIVYWMASLAPKIFDIVLSLLAVFNPFRLFGWTITGASQLNIPLLGPVVTMISRIYVTVQDLSIIVAVPVLLGLTAISIFMFRGNAGKKITRLVVRVFMIFAGLPLIGATYTGIIDDLGDQMNSGSQFADYIVLSQFVDFEGWAINNRLTPPATPMYRHGTIAGTISSGDSYSFDQASRPLVFEINGTRAGYYGTYRALKDNGADSLLSGVGLEGYDQQITQQSVMSLLERYRRNESFTSSDYEGVVKSQIDASMVGTNPTVTSSDVFDMFSMTSKDLVDEDSLFVYDGPWTIYNAGSLTGRVNGRNAYTLTGTTVSQDPVVGLKSIGDGSKGAGLSPLAMYNFLNTSFGTSSMTVYSPERATSGFTKESHASVTKANTGIVGGVQFLETIAIMALLAILGLFYAAGLVQVSIASIPRILSGVFGTAVGSMAFITKLLISTVVLIIEIIGTVLLYQVSESIVMGFIVNADEFIAGLPVTFAGPVSSLSSLVVVALSAMITWVSIKNRAKFAKMMEETVTNAITKLMGGLDNTMNQGSAFHNSGDLSRAAQQGTVFGNDGRIGSEGSGAHAAKLGDGVGDPGILQDMKGAMTDMFDIKDRDDRNPNTPEMTNADVAKGAMSRLAKRRAARGKDIVANAFGPIGGMAAQMMGIDGVDGHELERVDRNEEIEKDMITKGELGFGPSAKYNPDTQMMSGTDADDVGVNNNDGYGRSKSGMTSEQSLDTDADMDASMTIDSDGSDLTGSIPMSDDAFAEAIREANSDESLASLESVGDVDDEVGAVLAADGSVTADQEQMGSVKQASIETNDELDGVTDDFDDKADALMVNAFTDVDADLDVNSISLDDPDSHPDGVDPVSRDYNKYIDGLGSAMDAQSKSAIRHGKKATALSKHADELDTKASQLESVGTPKAMERASDMRSQSKKLRHQAEVEKAKGRQSMRKAQKLGAKQESAQAIRNHAISGAPDRMSDSVQASMAYAEADSELRSLQTRAQGLRNTLNELEDSGSTDFEKIATTRENLNAMESKLPEANRKRDRAMQNVLATKAMKTSSLMGQNVRDMTPKQRMQFQKETGMTDAEMTRRIESTPTASEHRKAVDRAARVLGRLPEITGDTTENTISNQRSYVSKYKDAYAQSFVEASERIENANANLVKLQSDGAPSSQINKAVAQVSQAMSNMKSLERESRAYDEVLSQGFTEHVGNLSQQDHMKRFARSSDKAQKSRQNVLTNPKPYQQFASQNLMPTPRHPNARVESGAIPQLRSTQNTSVMAKKQALNNANIKTYGDYRTELNKKSAVVESKKAEISRLDNRIRTAERERRLGDAQRFKSDKMRAQQTMIETRREADKLQQNLSQNVAGLFTKGYTSNVPGLTPKNKPIMADMDYVTRMMQDYSVTQRQLERFEATLPKEPSKVQKLRLDKMRKSVNGMRRQLTGVGIRPDALADSKRSATAAQQLTTEWLDVKRGSATNIR